MKTNLLKLVDWVTQRGPAWLAAAGVAAVMVLLPVVHLVVVAVNFVVHIGVLGLQFVTTRLARKAPETTASLTNNDGELPFISVNVPAHNEPPEMLKRTLRSLARLDYENYEVLVIDNNTSDPALWKPIETFCKQLGDRFKFLHVENLPGFKAGAMNWAHQFMNPKAEHIFVVDADYVVDAKALKTALSHVSRPDIGLVQFPQDYRNIAPGNLGIALDFKHFFSCYMNMANRLGCVPSTGTLSLIRVKALAAIDGFGTDVITEDADLGLRMGLEGYRAVYVHESIGHGVVPHDLEGLKKQRWRWAFGNAQILKLGWRRLLFSPKIRFTQKLGYLSHLTAWFNFNLIPSLSLVVLGIAALVTDISPIQQGILALSSATLASFFVIRFATFYSGLRRDGHSLGEIVAAFATHIGLGWIFGASWLKCLWDHRSPFVRTNKFIGSMPGMLASTLTELMLGIALVAACIQLAFYNHLLAASIALIMGAARLLIYWVYRQTRITLELTRLVEANQPVPNAIRSFDPHPGSSDDQPVSSLLLNGSRTRIRPS
jgi:cellulose synthase/poly-beta-1,6-N-acetylglucosamine synthase-like glycosyltransferase